MNKHFGLQALLVLIVIGCAWQGSHAGCSDTAPTTPSGISQPADRLIPKGVKQDYAFKEVMVLSHWMWSNGKTFSLFGGEAR